MKKILVRADDLGYSEGVNYGIAKSVKEGIICSVGVMPNMDAISHGLKLLEGTGVCLGQHTNICIGRPITDPTLIPSIVQANGHFKSSREYRSAEKDFVALDEVIIEIEAQYHRFVELTGKQPGYFEGHAVASKNFFKGLAIVAEKYHLKYQPACLGSESTVVGTTEVWMHMDSMNPKDYDPVAFLKEIVEHSHDYGCEIMVCHPGYLDDYILNNSTLTIPPVPSGVTEPSNILYGFCLHGRHGQILLKPIF